MVHADAYDSILGDATEDSAAASSAHYCKCPKAAIYMMQPTTRAVSLISYTMQIIAHQYANVHSFKSPQ
jgi:hypothetical protein